ncbi:hypothetical protein G3A_14080 [Bacillus sp. 17376]|uniref:Antigen I/II N-terminal domain-containing protein n=1 Tax=Mesobacillus boroniphilus JCM 21738 TaxID=1294265 RepID=W4RPK4_9BACI|nr:hypothetical protein [Mesobacillus boroniphilus]ESU31939.1 hypothetical protein G3A_14080 [Bacillus sp. 17376]GAE45803.1 hypothetical protein JCM21738_2649 [Mesobacillus boroniphilus JCM 21738]
MKKLIIVLLLTLSALLAACSSEGEVSEQGTKKEQNGKEEKAKSEDEGSVEVDKGLFNVEVTLPASMFEGEDIDSAIEEAKAEGVKEVIKNDDGSITYKMSKSEHKKMMKELETGIQESLEEMKTSGDFASIKDVTHNKNYSEFTLEVDKATYENSMDGFAVFGLGISGVYYQLFNGAKEDDYKVTINVKDQATGEDFDQIVFPDDMEENE